MVDGRRLRIDPTLNEDQGIWQATATNKAGSAQHAIYLKVCADVFVFHVCDQWASEELNVGQLKNIFRMNSKTMSDLLTHITLVTLFNIFFSKLIRPDQVSPLKIQEALNPLSYRYKKH